MFGPEQQSIQSDQVNTYSPSQSVQSQSPMINSKENTIIIPDYSEISSSFAPRKTKARMLCGRAVD